MTATASFTAAVRAVLASTDQRDDVRGLARKAVSLMDDSLVLEAAITHLAGIARRLHNEDVRANGSTSASSQEVVNVRGVDILLGSTTKEDRDYLVANRETLANGLLARAARIREFGASGPALDRLTSAAVLAAEAQARSLESMADALEHLCDGLGSGLSPAEVEAAKETATIAAELDQVLSETERLEAVAREMLEDEEVGPGLWGQTRRAVRRLRELFGSAA